MATTLRNPRYRQSGQAPNAFAATLRNPRRHGGDRQWGGPGRVIETVTRLNAPERARVRLCDERSGMFLREAWSDAVTGDVEFRDLALAVPYVLYALDQTGTYEAVIIQSRYATLDGARP